MPKRLAETVRSYQEKHGTASCPIEDGAIGNLADNECEHGSLPRDTKLKCDCFPKPKAKR